MTKQLLLLPLLLLLLAACGDKAETSGNETPEAEVGMSAADADKGMTALLAGNTAEAEPYVCAENLETLGTQDFDVIRYSPMREETYEYQGAAYRVLDVPIEGTNRPLALVNRGRTTSEFIDPANPEAGLIPWEGNTRTLLAYWIIDPTLQAEWPDQVSMTSTCTPDGDTMTCLLAFSSNPEGQFLTMDYTIAWQVEEGKLCKPLVSAVIP